jgi:hypothetical protein
LVGDQVVGLPQEVLDGTLLRLNRPHGVLKKSHLAAVVTLGHAPRWPVTSYQVGRLQVGGLVKVLPDLAERGIHLDDLKHKMNH